MGPVGVPRIYLEYPEPQKKSGKSQNQNPRFVKHLFEIKHFLIPDFILEPTWSTDMTENL